MPPPHAYVQPLFLLHKHYFIISARHARKQMRAYLISRRVRIAIAHLDGLLIIVVAIRVQIIGNLPRILQAGAAVRAMFIYFFQRVA